MQFYRLAVRYDHLGVFRRQRVNQSTTTNFPPSLGLGSFRFNPRLYRSRFFRSSVSSHVTQLVLINPMEHRLIWETNRFSARQCSALYGTRRFITYHFHRSLLRTLRLVFQFHFQVPVTVHREQSVKREDQQDATIRCLLLTSVSTCFGHHYAHLQENKDRVLLHLVCCSGSAGCGW